MKNEVFVRSMALCDEADMLGAELAPQETGVDLPPAQGNQVTHLLPAARTEFPCPSREFRVGKNSLFVATWNVNGLPAPEDDLADLFFGVDGKAQPADIYAIG